MASTRDAPDTLAKRRRSRQRRHPVERARRSAAESGFALLLALVGLSFIYLLAAGGFTLALLEGRMSEAHRVSVEAFYAADAALRSELTRPRPTEPSEWDYPELAVRVERTPLLELAGGERLVHYTARATSGLPGREEATRIVRSVALTPPNAELPAALVAVAGVDGAGPDVRIDGGESAEPACPAAEPVAGLLAPTGGSYEWAMIEGTPPIREDDEVAEAVPFWRPPWPLDFLAEDPDVTVVPPGAPAASGEGLLLAPGDLHLPGGFEWRGLVLVGGALRAEAGVRIAGGLATGLDRLAGGAPSPSWLGPGPVEIVADPCLAEAAAAPLAGPAAVPGTWSEAF